MKAPATIVFGLLPLFLGGCVFHKHPAQAQAQGPLAPVIVDNPPPPPSTASVNPPANEASIPSKPTTTAPTPPKQQPKPKKPANKPPTPVNASETTQEAANPAPSPGVSAIGELSSGDPGDYRQQTADSITSIEKGLNGITRTLDDNEQKTADHIREFLKQARMALSSGDVDGAHTLAAKARVLLNELTQ
jgi:hypothetical protein